MRTCSKCGCYIPDNWTACPACHTGERNEPKVFPNGVYRVKIFFDPYGMDETIFCQKANAIGYAQRKANNALVKAVEVWECQTHARIYFLSKNS